MIFSIRYSFFQVWVVQGVQNLEPTTNSIFEFWLRSVNYFFQTTFLLEHASEGMESMFMTFGQFLGFGSEVSTISSNELFGPKWNTASVQGPQTPQKTNIFNVWYHPP